MAVKLPGSMVEVPMGLSSHPASQKPSRNISVYACRIRYRFISILCSYGDVVPSIPQRQPLQHNAVAFVDEIAAAEVEEKF